MLLITGCSVQRGPVGFWSRNRLVHNERRGPWRTYLDAADTHVGTRGHYRHDRPVGYWRYYRYDGSLEHTERYHRHGEMRLRYFHPNGKLASQGQARIEVLPDTMHFYWYGTWRLYDTTGRENGWELYQNGWRAARGTTAPKPLRSNK
ncbi:hypothetical protein B0919_02710 [Hymenobacter sp. CRA2]|nr:hypothetical protein B0919_02710 [Hymenobacter sp. CRA2]